MHPLHAQIRSGDLMEALQCFVGSMRLGYEEDWQRIVEIGMEKQVSVNMKESRGQFLIYLFFTLCTLTSSSCLLYFSYKLCMNYLSYYLQLQYM